MKPHYISILKGQALLKAAAVIALVMVWILIDKGNALGQGSKDARQSVKQSEAAAQNPTPLFRNGNGGRDGKPGGDGGDEDGDFNIYPNPVKDDAVFDFEFTVRTDIPYEITDALGRLVERGSFEPEIQQQTVNFSQYRSGLYLVRVQVGNRAVVKRVIKQ